MIGAGLAAYPLFDAGDLFFVAAAIGAFALVALGVALVFDARPLLWALVLLTVEYTLVDLVQTQSLLVAPFYGTGLLLIGELTYAGGEVRWTRLLTFSGAALTASFVCVLAAGTSAPGVGAAVLALAAAAGLLATPLLLLRRR